MKLKRVNLEPRFAANCICCGTVAGFAAERNVTELWADLDGEAFKAYYCRSCAEKQAGHSISTVDPTCGAKETHRKGTLCGVCGGAA